MLTGTFVFVIVSDQCYTWSDDDRDKTRRRAAETSRRSGAPTAAAEIDPARFADRAVQTMRQVRMQMRRRARTWPQVLSVCEFSGAAAANGLRAARDISTCGGVCRQLSPGPRDSRRGLRHQPRVAASPRSTLRRHPEPAASHISDLDRCAGRRRDSGQHVGQLARRNSGEFILFGGGR